jgi:hypothetical protein
MLKHYIKRSKTSACCAAILLVTMLTGIPVQAETGSEMIGQRVKSSLNAMVQDVHEAGTPSEKRAVLNRFLSKVSRGTAILEILPFLSDENHAAVDLLKERFDRYSADFGGTPGTNAVADGDLDAFASYMQNDLEQASGGIYLSTGAVIIVLLIILILL